MIELTEVAWTKLFAFALPNPVKARTIKCVCGGKNCQTAKKIKCACACHSTNHGEANRVGMQPLDGLLELDGLEIKETSPRRLGDQALNRELSGFAEVEGEF